MPLPGWYPDPSGDYEYRYWDGNRWTDDVASYGHQTVDPVEEPVVPAQEQVLWTHGRCQLSTHRAWVNDGLTRGRIEEIPLWSVADVELTINAGQQLAGTGRVALRIAYPGYTGRAHLVMTGVPNAREVAALARKWARRNRRAAELG